MGESVTVVSGLPRSGTSMMMQLLAAGGMPILTDHVRRADEDNPRGYYEFERVKEVRQDSSWLNEAEGKAVKMVYRLLYDLPADHTYQVIFLRRPIEEVLDSQEEMLRRQGKGEEAVDRTQLGNLYRRQLKDVETWLQGQPNFRVHYVEYHDVLDDAHRVVHEINRFLGGALDVGAMLQVPDRTLYRQRR